MRTAATLATLCLTALLSVPSHAQMSTGKTFGEHPPENQEFIIRVFGSLPILTEEEQTIYNDLTSQVTCAEGEELVTGIHMSGTALGGQATPVSGDLIITRTFHYTFLCSEDLARLE